MMHTFTLILLIFFAADVLGLFVIVALTQRSRRWATLRDLGGLLVFLMIVMAIIYGCVWGLVQFFG